MWRKKIWIVRCVVRNTFLGTFDLESVRDVCLWVKCEFYYCSPVTSTLGMEFIIYKCISSALQIRNWRNWKLRPAIVQSQCVRCAAWRASQRPRSSASIGDSRQSVRRGWCVRMRSKPYTRSSFPMDVSEGGKLAFERSIRLSISCYFCSFYKLWHSDQNRPFLKFGCPTALPIHYFGLFSFQPTAACTPITCLTHWTRVAVASLALRWGTGAMIDATNSRMRCSWRALGLIRW